jgi:regulatory protein
MQFAFEFQNTSGAMSPQQLAFSAAATFRNRIDNRNMTNDERSRDDRARETRQPATTRSKQRALDLNAKTPSAAEVAQKLRNKALRLLTTREHSKEELLRKLAQAKARVARKNVEENDRETKQRDKDDIEAMVDALAAQGWQSDERYADAMIRRLAGQASRRYIADKLAHAGIKKEVSQLALEALDQDDREIAKALWQRRFGEVPKDEKERQRQIRFLLSRGFHLSDAFRIVPASSQTRRRPD